ncbi:hypothetical protein [Pauljensenia hongkongensis]|nr:hypothetical protein [Pauljensenia hongkongensis]
MVNAERQFDQIACDFVGQRAERLADYERDLRENLNESGARRLRDQFALPLCRRSVRLAIRFSIRSARNPFTRFPRRFPTRPACNPFTRFPRRFPTRFARR